MDTFTLTFTCTCGEPSEEIFIDNEDSKKALLAMIEALILEGVEDMQVIRNVADGSKHDETLPILFAIAVVAAFRGL